MEIDEPPACARQACLARLILLEGDPLHPQGDGGGLGLLLLGTCTADTK